MNKTDIQFSLATLLVVLAISMSVSSFSEVYATGDDKKIADKKTEGRKFHQAIIKTDDEKHRVDADYDVAINDDDTYSITKNGDAEDIKNLDCVQVRI